MNLYVSPPPDANGNGVNNVRGLVSLIAQTFAGVKTFAAKIIAAAGIEIYGVADPAFRIGTGNDSSSSVAFYSTAAADFSSFTSRTFVYSRNTQFCLESSTGVIKAGGNQGLGPTDTHFEVSGAGSVRGPLGAGSSDVAMKIGSTVADGSVHANAKIASIGTGIGGTFVERAWFKKSGTDGYILGASAGTIVCNGSAGLSLNWSTVSIGVDGVSVTILESGTQGAIFKILSTAEIKVKGLDRSATVGADTQNKPSGINTIAAAATTCRITNSLVPDPASTKVRIAIEWRGDHGAARSWVVQGNGFFDVTLSAGAGGNTSFDWQVNGLL